MRECIFTTLLVLSTLPAFAQRDTGTCHVVAVDRYKRPTDHFYGPSDRQTGKCREALRRCVNETRRRGQSGLSCIEVRGH